MHSFGFLIFFTILVFIVVDGDTRPNFIFVLADDLNFDFKQNRKTMMPTLKKYLADGGLEFHNHVAAVPVCGPSRSSLLAGRYPHNTHYVKNNGKWSKGNWTKQQNNTIGTWLTKSGYYTAFLGKYVNGLESTVPTGWRHWGGLTNNAISLNGTTIKLGGTYNFYNASQWDVDFDVTGKNQLGPKKYHIWTGVHQSEFLGKQTVQHVRKAISLDQPFFIHCTPVMVHWGTCYGPQPEKKYAPTDPHFEMEGLIDPTTKRKIRVPISACPTTKHAHDFDGVTNPHVASWNQSEQGTVPGWIQKRGNVSVNGCCDEWKSSREDIGFRNRSASVVDLDDMIATIFSGLEELNVLNNTYVIFSSDNGYHLGEHHLLFGKSEPYETDIRLPMYIRGPGVPKGEKRSHPTTHLDITATIVDLAGAIQHSPRNLDGKSFKSALSHLPSTVAKWRNFSFSEFYVNDNTWHAMRHINETTGEAEWTFHSWCKNFTEVFHKPSDPWQLQNLAGKSPTPFGKHIMDTYLPITIALGKCSGTTCNNPEPHSIPSTLPCYTGEP